MKNVKKDLDDSLRPEYTRSDFAEMIQGKYAAAPIEFADLVRILLACIGEDEGLRFVNQPKNQPSSHNSNPCTYTIDNANQVTLRFRVNDLECVEERISTPCCITTPEERTILQERLLNHVRTLKAKAGI